MGGVQRVLVIGGGVGGLAAANALAQRGIEAVLVERQPDFSLTGVGLGQPANALRAYRDLGVLDEVLKQGFVYRSMRYFDQDRQLIAEHKFLMGDSEIPPVCALSREKLHEILLQAAVNRGVEVRMGTTAIGFRDTGDSVEVDLSDGETLKVDVVAGFDGIRSTTRETIFGGAFVPRPSGYGAWRIQERRPPEVDAMEFFQHVGSKTGAMPLNDELMYLFHIRREDPAVWFAHDTLHTELARRLEGFGSYVGAARDRLGPDSEVVYSPLELLLVHGPWFRGRIVLGGDAAHVVPPHLTQGAAMAVEDGVILAQELSAPRATVGEALARYTDRRYARCSFVYMFARQMLDEEQSVCSPADLDRFRIDVAANGSERIAVSDRILDEPYLENSIRKVVSA